MRSCLALPCTAALSRCSQRLKLAIKIKDEFASAEHLVAPAAKAGPGPGEHPMPMPHVCFVNSFVRAEHPLGRMHACTHSPRAHACARPPCMHGVDIRASPSMRVSINALHGRDGCMHCLTLAMVSTCMLGRTRISIPCTVRPRRLHVRAPPRPRPRLRTAEVVAVVGLPMRGHACVIWSP